MLRIFIQDYENLREIENLINDCLDFNQDSKITAHTNLDDILFQINNLELPALFILEYAKSDILYKAIANIRQQNNLHYIILRLNSAEEAFIPFPPYIRPSGYLLKTADKNICRPLIDNIYNDFSSVHNIYGGYFSLKMDGSVYRLDYTKILYFESLQKKIIARIGVQEYDFYDSMEEICKKVPEYFLRIHRGFCINTRLVDTINIKDRTVQMQDGSVIPYSKTYREQLLEAVTRKL